jgi:hypothetical protein
MHKNRVKFPIRRTLAVFTFVAGILAPVFAQTHTIGLGLAQGLQLRDVPGGGFTAGGVRYSGLTTGERYWEIYPGTGLHFEYAFDYLEDDPFFLEQGTRFNLGTVLSADCIYSPQSSFAQIGGGFNAVVWKIRGQFIISYAHFFNTINTSNRDHPFVSLTGTYISTSIGFQNLIPGLKISNAYAFYFIDLCVDSYFGLNAVGEGARLKGGFAWIIPDSWS